MIDNSYLLGLYGGTSTFGAASGSLLSTGGSSRKQPTPPWDSKAVVPKADALVRAALGGRKIVDESAPVVDLKSAPADYRKLFALYQGLETLNALTNRAAVKGISTTEQSLLAKRFASGLSEIGGWLTSARLDDVRLVQGVTSSLSKTTAGVTRDSAISMTAPIHEGSPEDPVAAFQGDVAFDITIKRSIDTQTVSIDLADMGATPRSLSAVTAFINGKLEAAGVETRFGREQIKAEPRTLQVNGKTVTLPAGADRWALAIRGVSTETVSFSAAQTSDAVYVVQGVGGGGEELLKFQSDGGGAADPTGGRIGETFWVDGRLSQTRLPDGVDAIRASAVGPDGSLWLVADLTAGAGDRPIKGEKDVALMKFDSAGRLVSTHALGAATSASGYALAVDADGKVAVAGSVTGALEAGKSGDVATEVDSFVSVFDTSGAELWTQRRGARAADEATSVSFGADGAVYVGGRAKSAMPGATAAGDWDGYVQGFRGGQPYPTAAWTATSLGVSQFGTSGEDGVSAVAVDGSSLYSAGVENGRLVVRKFTLGPDGSATLAATRDLGEASGEVGGLAVSGGQVVLSGTTRNAALDIGTVNQAHAGGTDAFIAVLDGDLAASGAERLTYYGGAGDDTAADVKIAGGKVWLTGVSDRPVDAKDEDPVQAYLARIDPLSGAVEWSRQWSGQGETARPATLAVAAGGASVLDRLGLPKGEITQSGSKKLVDATALRAGDRFYISPAGGGRPVAVTIEARDTLQTLARKIEQASNMALKVDVSSISAENVEGSRSQTALQAGLQRLTISARSGRAGAVLTAGDSGRDALAGLGLSPGFIGVSSGDDGPRTFGLGLPAGLTLNDAAAIKTAGEKLQAAMKAVRDAYRALAPKSTASAATGTAPAYYTTQLANYQAALARLTGG